MNPNYKEKVIITNKDILTTVIPLFQIVEGFELQRLDKLEVCCVNPNIIGYAIMASDDGEYIIVNRDVVEKHSIFLGEL